MFPPIPPWEAMHPLVVHFPIALLLIAPVFLALGLLIEKSRPWFLLAGLLMAVLGTASAWLAINTGEATARAVEQTAFISKEIHRHEEVAETATILFTILTLLYGVFVAVPLVAKKPMKRPTELVFGSSLLLAWSISALFLVQAAHLGGMLVHRHGVLAPFGEPTEQHEESH